MPAQDSLVRLVAANRSNKLRSYNKARGGFVDARGPKPAVLCGVHTFLHKRCRGFPKLSKKQYRARKRVKQYSSKASSKQTGKYFHRQVHHTLICATVAADRANNACLCPDGATKAVVRKQSAAFEMVQAAQDFMRNELLVPLCGEQVITSTQFSLGTRFDMLCERTGRPGHMVLVSWKTGGECPFENDVRLVSAEKYICVPVTETTASETIVCREHLAQLALELHMLRDEHEITGIHEAFIVYLAPRKRQYRTVCLDRESIAGGGYDRVWKYILRMRN